MYSVGLDVHQKRSSLEILDAHGALFKRVQVKGAWPTLLREVEKLPRPFAICYEASCGYGYLHDELGKRADRVVVAHPGHLRLIFRSKKKNDRIDAAKIAKLLYLNEVPQVHVPRGDVRGWRALIEYRRKLLGQRTGIKNQVRALLRGLGMVVARGLWTKKGQQWLKEQAMGAGDDLRRQIMMEELEELTAKINRVEKELAQIAQGHAGVALLMTIPGVGMRTAEAFMAYVDDIQRFLRTRQVGSYFGLVPCQDSSSQVNRLGHITKDGPATVRGLLCEAAWQGVLRSPTIRRFYQRVMHGQKERRKIALVATAHYLVRVMAAMLRTGEIWRESPAPEQTDQPRSVSPEDGSQGGTHQ
jgi:transposase